MGCRGPPWGKCPSRSREAGSLFGFYGTLLCDGGWVALLLWASLSSLQWIGRSHSGWLTVGLVSRIKGELDVKRLCNCSSLEPWRRHGNFILPGDASCPPGVSNRLLLRSKGKPVQGPCGCPAHKEGLFEIKLRRHSPSGGLGERVIYLFA